MVESNALLLTGEPHRLWLGTLAVLARLPGPVAETTLNAGSHCTGHDASTLGGQTNFLASP